MNKLLGASLILAAISMSKQAGYSSSNNSEAPAITKYGCNVVEGKKPWCACRSSLSSTTIDLSSLGTNLEALIRPPKFRSKPVQGWSIAWTPCEDFDMFTNITLNPDVGERACKGVGFARYTETSAKICNGYGSHENSAKFYSHYDGAGKESFYIEFLYIKAAQERRARIQLICTPNTDETSFEYLGDKAGLEVAKFSSKCCCSNEVCSKNGSHSHKMTAYQVGGGVIAGTFVAVIAVSVIIVIVIVIAAVVIYKRRHRIPHPVQEGAQEHDERYPILG